MNGFNCPFLDCAAFINTRFKIKKSNEEIILLYSLEKVVQSMGKRSKKASFSHPL